MRVEDFSSKNISLPPNIYHTLKSSEWSKTILITGGVVATGAGQTTRWGA